MVCRQFNFYYDIVWRRFMCMQNFSSVISLIVHAVQCFLLWCFIHSSCFQKSCIAQPLFSPQRSKLYLCLERHYYAYPATINVDHFLSWGGVKFFEILFRCQSGVHQVSIRCPGRFSWGIVPGINFFLDLQGVG